MAPLITTFLLLSILDSSKSFSHKKETVDVLSSSNKFKGVKVNHPVLEERYPDDSLYLSVAHGIRNINEPHTIQNEDGELQFISWLFVSQLRDTSIFKTSKTEAPAYALSYPQEIPGNSFVSNLHETLQISPTPIPLGDYPFGILVQSTPGDSGSLLTGSDGQIYGIQSSGHYSLTLYTPIPSLDNFVHPSINLTYPSNINRTLRYSDGSIEIQTGFTPFEDGYSLKQTFIQRATGEANIHSNASCSYTLKRLTIQEASNFEREDNGKYSLVSKVFDTEITPGYVTNKEVVYYFGNQTETEFDRKFNKHTGEISIGKTEEKL